MSPGHTLHLDYPFPTGFSAFHGYEREQLLFLKICLCNKLAGPFCAQKPLEALLPSAFSFNRLL